MADSKKSHDSLFKHVFSSTENATAILRAILPHALAKQIDWTSMQLCSGSHVDTLLADAHSDLLFSTRVAGSPALIYLLFEHQSRPDELMPLRLLKYVVRVLDWHVKEAESRAEPRLPLPLVVPIVLHHSDRGWTAARRLEKLFDPALAEDSEIGAFVPRLGFVLDDISDLSDEALRKRALGMLPTLALWVLRDGRDPERLLASLAHWAGLMGELWRAPSGQDALTAIFRYLSIVADVSADTLYTVIETQAPDVKEALMTLAEQWMAQGEAKGRAVAVLAVLEARQKTLTAQQRTKVESCTDLAVLDAWLRKAATLNDTRELFDQPE